MPKYSDKPCARVNALARAEGKTYGYYVALYEPRKGLCR